MKKRVFSCLFFLIVVNSSFSQKKLGVVMSGGGAAGIAHIGVLKALEENDIAIDYITGTSMGALIGAMYASGISPTDIEKYFISENFEKLANGEIDPKYIYFFEKLEQNPSIIGIKFSSKDLLKTTLPTNFLSSTPLDWELAKRFASIEAATNYDFNQLFVPFRCVASDIENKKPVVFSSGHLSQSIRASIAYPFFLNPITINNKVLFDGGIYNNFPADIMMENFKPNLIIGSNVASNAPRPEENNVISLVLNMLLSKTDYNLPTEEGIIIQPNTGRSTFNFTNLQEVIDSGYVSTLREIEYIKQVAPKRSQQEVENKRKAFTSQVKPVEVQNITFEGLSDKAEVYAQRLLRYKVKPQDIESIEPKFYRLFGDNKIYSIFPQFDYNSETGFYDLNLKTQSEKEFRFDVGGVFSNRPINMGYVGLSYSILRKQSITLEGYSHFGKFFGSASGNISFKLPAKLPIYAKLGYTRNRWNYFKSRAIFFEDLKPSYLVQYEDNLDFKLGFPIKNFSRFKLGGSINNLKDEYYQTRNFLSTDTTDVTLFNAYSLFAEYEVNTLNKKLYPNKGSVLQARIRFISGQEVHEPGSTAENKIVQTDYKEWLQLFLKYETFYKNSGVLRLGIHLQGMYSNPPVFNNYTASILRSPIYEPIPESRTLFLETFRAYQYIALGHQVIFNIRSNIDLRLEAYVFQPFSRVDASNNKVVTETIQRRYTIASGNLVFHSPLGPISASVNYYLNEPEVAIEQREPISFLLHFGYLIFNKRGLE